jgi:glutamate-1-semialdehyde aminotransferase
MSQPMHRAHGKGSRRLECQGGVAAQVTGLGSLFAIHLTADPVGTIRDAARGDAALRHRLFLGLYSAGILIDPRGVGTLSTVLDQQDLDHFVSVLRQVSGQLAEA